MSEQATFADRFKTAFRPAGGGVVALTEQVLHLFGEPGAVIECREGRCWCQPRGSAEKEAVEVPLSKPLFRAILARVAAMCNEQSPGAVSPYGGAGDLTTGGTPSGRFHVEFLNTAGEQRLEVRLLSAAANTPNSSPEASATNGPIRR
jgi:hypothetical protein